MLSSSLTQYNDYIKTAKKSTNVNKSAMVTRVGKKIAAATEDYLRANGMADEVKNFSWVVKDLAELSGYSLSSLKVQFKPFFGMTPYTWLLEKKLDMLKLSLADESKPLKLIVDELGFSDQSHLNNFCKRYLGGTALQVRSNAHALGK